MERQHPESFRGWVSTGRTIKRHHSPRWSMSGATYLLVAACVLPSPSIAGELSWIQLSDGIRVSVWKAQDKCPIVPRMLVVDLDPERIRFSVHYYAQEGLSEPLRIDQWQKRTGHHVVFNGGYSVKTSRTLVSSIRTGVRWEADNTLRGAGCLLRSRLMWECERRESLIWTRRPSMKSDHPIERRHRL